MRRKSKKEIIKEHLLLNILSSLFILFGLVCAILPHIIPRVEYASLQAKEVTVTAFRHFRGGPRGISYDAIYTADGEKYNISGDYRREQLEELLTEEKDAVIKWYKSKPFGTLLTEEMDVDGERVVTYNNDKPADWKFSLLFGGCFVAVGLGGFLLLGSFVKENREKQKKRDEKIRKKYGK